MDKINVRVLILDDEPNALEAARRAVANYVPEENIACASNAVEAMRLVETTPVELVFLDIEMADTHGFSVAEYICRTRPQVKLVFLTGHVELGAESFDFAPLDFLSKPVDVVRLQKTMERYVAAVKPAADRSRAVVVETGEGFVLLPPGDILYIAKEGRKTVIHTKQGGEHAVSSSLDELEVIFSDYALVRVHQSFLVPLEEIVALKRGGIGKTYVVTLRSGESLPVSRSRYAQFRQELSERGARFL